MDELVSNAPNSMKPGMTHVVRPGETVVIRDREGQEIGVEGRESEAVLAFFRAFDDWLTAKRRGNVTMGILEPLFRQVEASFAALPAHIRRELRTHSLAGSGLRL